MMSFTTKFILPSAVFSALFFAACGASDSSDVAKSAAQEPAQVSVPSDPVAAMEMIAKELASGNGGILWKAMPASYQSDVDTIAKLAGARMDSEIYNKSFALIGRLAEVAEKQKDFILNTELGGQQSAEEVAQMEATFPSIVGFTKSLASSSISSVEGLQAFDGQSFFDTTVSELIQHLDGMSALSGDELSISDLSGFAFKVLTLTETAATLEMTSPEGDVEIEDFAKVEDRWVPSEMADEWAESMADTKAQLEALDPIELAQSKPQIMGVITMLEGVLKQIEGAETQEQFDQALQGAMMPIMGLMMMQGGGLGAPTAPAMPNLQ